MYIYTVTRCIPKVNLFVRPISNLCRVQWKSPLLSCYRRVFSRCRYSVTEGAHGVTAQGSLKMTEKFQLAVQSLNNCLDPGVSGNQTGVFRNWCVALADMFNFLPRVRICRQQSDTRIWHLITCALPPPHTADFPTYFSSLQRRLTVSGNFEKNTRFVSQKPDKDSSQKPSASQLSNVQELMIKEVM